MTLQVDIVTKFIESYREDLDLKKLTWCVTGSQVYGSPTAESGLDLVFKEEPGVRDLLNDAGFEETEPDDPGDPGEYIAELVVKDEPDFGRRDTTYEDSASLYNEDKSVNIILVPPHEYPFWVQAQKICLLLANTYKPLTREQAVDLHKSILHTSRALYKEMETP